MSAIKNDAVDVFAMLYQDKVIVSVNVNGTTAGTFEYSLYDLADELIASSRGDNGLIEGDDAEDAYDTVDALDEASYRINRMIAD